MEQKKRYSAKTAEDVIGRKAIKALLKELNELKDRVEKIEKTVKYELIKRGES